VNNSIDDNGPEPEFDVKAYLRDDDAAKATDCGFPDCDGGGHEKGLSPTTEWGHRLAHAAFDEAVGVEFYKFGSETPIVYLEMEARGEMSAVELRADADLYEAYPAWLRARADELEAFSAAVK
jgi:hypothetical protein